jgi:anti-anti-sigma regulatory factor
VPIETRSDHVFWQLPTLTNIYGVSALKQDLQAALNEGRDILISIDEVDEFDGAGVQLLLAAKTFSERQNRSVRLAGSKAAVASALITMGLGSMLGEAV